MSARPETRWAPLPEFPLISVVLPVRNEEQFIEDTLAQLLSQDYPRDRVEFLVCDGMSDDRTREIVAEVAAREDRVRLVDNPGRRSSAGRNAGFRAGRGDVFVVVDGHVRIPDNQLLRSVARVFRATGAACLGRPQPLVGTKPASLSEAIAIARSSALGHSSSSFIYSEHEGEAPAASIGAAYRREVFEEIGHVDEGFDACEDLEFNTRADEAGMLCVTSPSLTVEYFARDDLRGLFRQMHRYGYGRYKYLRRHPSAFSFMQLAPLAFVLGLFALGPLALGFAAALLGALPAHLVPALGTLLGLGLGCVSLYGAVVVAVSLRLAARTLWRHFPRFLAIFPVIHGALGLGFLGSMLRRGRIPGHGQPSPVKA